MSDQRLLKCKHPRLREALTFQPLVKNQPKPTPTPDPKAPNKVELDPTATLQFKLITGVLRGFFTGLKLLTTPL